MSGEEEEPPKTVTMPAGLYRLYAIADGKPVRATLTLPGLSGTTTVEPHVPVAQTLFTLPRIDGTGPSNVSTFGGEGTLHSDGLRALRLDVDERNSTRIDIEVCEFGPGDTATSFGPGCGDPERLATERVVWPAQSIAFTVAFFPTFAPSWAPYAADTIADGEIPYIPGSPFQAPWSGTWGELWTVSDAQAGKWLQGGNIQIYGDPGSTSSMGGLWMNWERAPGTPAPVAPPDLPAPAPPPAAPAPAPALPAVAAPAPVAVTPKKKPAVKKASKAKCKKVKRGKKRVKVCKKAKAKAKKRRPAARKR
jgi:hypothetical protein